MTAIHELPSDIDISLEEETAAELARGDLVRLLARLKTGELDAESIDKAMKQHASKHWFREFLLALLDRD